MGDNGMPPRLRDLLGDVGGRLGMRDAVATGLVWDRWTEIVGSQVGEHAEPTSLREGVLRIRTDSPAWATEIGYFAPEIVRRINEVVGRALVDEVKVWTAPGLLRDPRPARAQPPRPQEGAVSAQPERGEERDPRTALQAARAAWERARKPSRESP